LNRFEHQSVLQPKDRFDNNKCLDNSMADD
jgi:hypothetical protein